MGIRGGRDTRNSLISDDDLIGSHTVEYSMEKLMELQVGQSKTEGSLVTVRGGGGGDNSIYDFNWRITRLPDADPVVGPVTRVLDQVRESSIVRAADQSARDRRLARGADGVARDRSFRGADDCLVTTLPARGSQGEFRSERDGPTSAGQEAGLTRLRAPASRSPEPMA